MLAMLGWDLAICPCGLKGVGISRVETETARCCRKNTRNIEVEASDSSRLAGLDAAHGGCGKYGKQLELTPSGLDLAPLQLSSVVHEPDEIQARVADSSWLQLARHGPSPPGLFLSTQRLLI